MTARACQSILATIPYDPTPRKESKPVVGPPKKRRKGPWIMLALSILCLVLMVACLALPWYFIDNDETSTHTIDEYSLSGMTRSVETQDGFNSTFISYGDEEFEEEGHTVGVFNTTLGLAILLMIMDAVVIVLFVLLLLRIIPMKIVGIFGIVVIIFSMIVPFYLFATLPGALTEDADDAEIAYYEGVSPYNSFGGKGERREISWGPAMGWYLPFLHLVLMVIGTFFLVHKPKEREEIPITPEKKVKNGEPLETSAHSQDLKFCSSCNATVAAEGNTCPFCGRYLR